jgi:hypothetical protein
MQVYWHLLDCLKEHQCYRVRNALRKCEAHLSMELLIAVNGERDGGVCYDGFGRLGELADEFHYYRLLLGARESLCFPLLMLLLHTIEGHTCACKATSSTDARSCQSIMQACIQRKCRGIRATRCGMHLASHTETLRTYQVALCSSIFLYVLMATALARLK